MIRIIREASMAVKISRDDFDRMCRENSILQGLSRSDYIEIRDLFNIGYEDFDAAVNDLWDGDDGYRSRDWYEDLLKKYTNSVNESLKESSDDSIKNFLIKKAQKVSSDLTGDAWISDQFVKSKGTRILLNIPIAKDIDSDRATKAEARAMKVYDTNDVWWDDFVLQVDVTDWFEDEGKSESLKESIVFSKETPQGKVEVSRHKDGTYHVLVNGEEHGWFDHDDLTSLKYYLKYKKDISDEDLAKATLFKESTQLKLFDDDMINDIDILYQWRPEEVEEILVKHGANPNNDTWITGLDLPAAYDEIMSTFKDKYSDDDEIDYDVAKVLGLVEESLSEEQSEIDKKIKEDTSRDDLLQSVSRMLSYEDWYDDNVEFHTKLHKDGSRWIYSDRPLGDNDARRVTGYIEDILVGRYDMNRQDFEVIRNKYSSGWTILFKESKSIKESSTTKYGEVRNEFSDLIKLYNDRKIKYLVPTNAYRFSTRYEIYDKNDYYIGVYEDVNDEHSEFFDDAFTEEMYGEWFRLYPTYRKKYYDDQFNESKSIKEVASIVKNESLTEDTFDYDENSERDQLIWDHLSTNFADKCLEIIGIDPEKVPEQEWFKLIDLLVRIYKMTEE